MVLLLSALFRACFEPLSWRGDHGPSFRIEGRSVFLGGVTTRRGSKPARISVGKEPNVERAEFFALPPLRGKTRCPHAKSLTRRSLRISLGSS
jgi:hypothetical protein